MREVVAVTGVMPGSRLALFRLPFGQPGSGGTPHPGSKRGFIHVTDTAQDPAARIARAQEWSRRTGRPVPPHLRPREPLNDAEPLGSVARLQRYGSHHQVGQAKVTPAQARRLRHKHGPSEARIVLGYTPARQPGPRAPRTPAQRRRAAKNAAQQARHAAKQAAV